MSSTMEVEDSQGAEKVAVHPLALVHMSDHYTRVTTGGSPLAQQAPVMGILFGTPGGVLLDAEDIPLDDPVRAVELHQAVFPQNIVVGSYRVTTQDVEPTADDLRQVMSLQKTLGTNTTTMYFGLLRLTAKQEEKEQASMTNKDEELPLLLFTLQNNSVLVAVDDWQLTTAAAERVAVERVLRDKPEPESDQIRNAWMALDSRLALLTEYLKFSMSTAAPTPEHYEMWRQVQGLLVQARLLRTTSTASGDGQSLSLLPQEVAVLAKTVDAVAWYTDKFRLMHEVRGGKGTPASLLDARRF